MYCIGTLLLVITTAAFISEIYLFDSVLLALFWLHIFNFSGFTLLGDDVLYNPFYGIIVSSRWMIRYSLNFPTCRYLLT